MYYNQQKLFPYYLTQKRMLNNINRHLAMELQQPAIFNDFYKYININFIIIVCANVEKKFVFSRHYSTLSTNKKEMCHFLQHCGP